MLCDVICVCLTGDKILLTADPDYFTIRQWRDLYLQFFKLQQNDPINVRYLKLEPVGIVI